MLHCISSIRPAFSLPNVTLCGGSLVYSAIFCLLCMQMTKKHRNGHMIKCDWLDRLSFREIEMINERQKRESNFMYLMIEFPQIVYDNHEYTVVFFEKVRTL